MNVWVQGAAYGLTVLLVVVALVDVARNRPAGNLALAVLAALELVLLVQAVLGLVQLAGTEREVAAVTFVSYVLGVLLIAPVAAFWALAERSRAGTAVLVVAALAVAAMVARIQAIWAGDA